MTEAVDHYTTLGIDRTATTAEIKKAYRELALKLHPDKNPNAATHERFQRIAAAYSVLSDGASKSVYDMKLFAKDHQSGQGFQYRYQYQYSASAASATPTNLNGSGGSRGSFSSGVNFDTKATHRPQTAGVQRTSTGGVPPPTSSTANKAGQSSSTGASSGYPSTSSTSTSTNSGPTSSSTPSSSTGGVNPRPQTSSGTRPNRPNLSGYTLSDAEIEQLRRMQERDDSVQKRAADYEAFLRTGDIRCGTQSRPSSAAPFRSTQPATFGTAAPNFPVHQSQTSDAPPPPPRTGSNLASATKAAQASAKLSDDAGFNGATQSKRPATASSWNGISPSNSTNSAGSSASGSSFSFVSEETVNSVLDAIRKEREQIEKREREVGKQERKPMSSSAPVAGEEKVKPPQKVASVGAVPSSSKASQRSSEASKEVSRGTPPLQTGAPAESSKKETRPTASPKPVPQQRPPPPSPESPPIETPVNLASTPPPMKMEEDVPLSASKPQTDSQTKHVKSTAIPTPPASPSAAPRSNAHSTVTGASLRIPQTETKATNQETTTDQAQSSAPTAPPRVGSDSTQQSSQSDSSSKPTSKSPSFVPKTTPISMAGRAGSANTFGSANTTHPQSKTLVDRFEVPKDDEVAELTAEELKLLLDRLEHKVRVARKALLVQNIK